MPDLGPYAFAVLASYAVALALLAAITGWSWYRWRRVRAEMERAERGDG
ncbi:heme exporter protein CcmD [Rubellimicrobium sp. CFH 75288]